jgi:hypothetical protein
MSNAPTMGHRPVRPASVTVGSSVALPSLGGAEHPARSVPELFPVKRARVSGNIQGSGQTDTGFPQRSGRDHHVTLPELGFCVPEIEPET